MIQESLQALREMAYAILSSCGHAGSTFILAGAVLAFILLGVLALALTPLLLIWEMCFRTIPNWIRKKLLRRLRSLRSAWSRTVYIGPGKNGI